MPVFISVAVEMLRLRVGNYSVDWKNIVPPTNVLCIRCPRTDSWLVRGRACVRNSQEVGADNLHLGRLLRSIFARVKSDFFLLSAGGVDEIVHSCSRYWVAVLLILPAIFYGC